MDLQNPSMMHSWSLTYELWAQLCMTRQCTAFAQLQGGIHMKLHDKYAQYALAVVLIVIAADYSLTQ